MAMCCLVTCILAVLWHPAAACAAKSTDMGSGSGGFVYVTADGVYETPDAEEILTQINEIRMEACREGVPDPVTGDPLTPEDYVPLQWSEGLAALAAQRAAEGSVYHSHTRPNGQDFYTVAGNGTEDALPYAQETLAWGFHGIAGSVRGWYSEKASYTDPDGAPAGHYMALISPANRFVGAADLSGYGGRDVCAAMFADRDFELQSRADGQTGKEDAAEQTDQSGKAGTADPAGVQVEVHETLMPEAVHSAVSEAVIVIGTAGRTGMLCRAE